MVVAKIVQQVYQYLMLFSLLIYTMIRLQSVVIQSRGTTPIYDYHPPWCGPVLTFSLCIHSLVAIVWATGRGPQHTTPRKPIADAAHKHRAS